MQLPTVGKKYHVNHDENTLRKIVYGPTYVPYNEDSQKLLLPQTTDMSRKDNLKLLYNSLPKGMCDNENESLKQAVNDIEMFQYSHETSTKHVLVQGVYVGSASPLIADIKTQPYSMLHGPFKSICRSRANPEKTLRIRGGAMQVYHHNQ